jgi:GNAT superfamily N-acetyltransferase
VSQEVIVRRATRKDQPVVLRFHRELYIQFRDQVAAPEVVPLFAYKDMEGTLRDDVDGLLGAHSARVFLAERDGVPVGYISGHLEVDMRRVLTRRGVIEDWYIDESARRAGVGSLLMEQLLDWFRSENCEMAESGTWAFNPGARKAHAKAGFAEIEIKLRRRL